MPDSVLSRSTRFHLSNQPSDLNPIQSQVDGLVTHFVEEAASPRTLAAMAAGGMAYRLGRLGILGLGAKATGRSALLLRSASIAGGFTAEVGTFEFANRGLATLAGDHNNPNAWRWGGQGGWAQGLASSGITFGMLKSAGFLGREQNVVFQHAFQSTAMVAGHNTAGIFGITPRPEGSLAEQLLHAEVTNIQLGAGMSLAHTFAPGLHGFEQALDLSLQARESTLAPNPRGALNPFAPQTAPATVDSEAVPPSEATFSEILGNRPLLMSSTEGNGQSGPPTATNVSSSSSSSSAPPPSVPERMGGGSVPPGPPRTLPPGGGNGRGRRPSSEGPSLREFTQRPAPRINSSAEGVDRVRALGQDRWALTFLRYGMHQLRDTPQTQKRFMDVMRHLFDSQGQKQVDLDPILQRLVEPEFRELNGQARAYGEALETLAPRLPRHLAEAILLLHRTRNLRTLEDYQSLSDTQIREMGLEPEAIISIGRNVYSFERNEILQTFRHPLLRERVQTVKLVKAIREYFGDDIRRDLLTRLEDPSVRNLPETQTVRDIVQLFRGSDVWRGLLQVLEHPAVLNLPEATGLREKVRQMVERQGDLKNILQDILNHPFLGQWLAQRPVEEAQELLRQTATLEEQGHSEEAKDIRSRIPKINELLNKQALNQQNEGERSLDIATILLQQILLRVSAENEGLQRTLRDYHWEPIYGSVRKQARLMQELNTLSRQKSETQDPELQKDLETKIGELETSLNNSFGLNSRRLTQKVADYLRDPAQGRIVLIEVARLSAFVRSLNRADRSALVDFLRSHLNDFTHDAQRAARPLIEASEAMDRGGERNQFEIAEGRYEKSREEWIQSLSIEEMERIATGLLPLESLNAAALEKTVEAQNRLGRALYALTEALRENRQSLKAENNRYWEQSDNGNFQLVREDLGLQLDQASEQMRRVREKIGEQAFQSRYQEAFNAKHSEAEGAIGVIEALINPEIRSKKNSLDINRSLEQALRRLSELREMTRDALRRERIKNRAFRVVSPLAALVSEKLDLYPQNAGRWFKRFRDARLGIQSLGALKPHRGTTVRAKNMLFESADHEESFIERLRIFRWWTDRITQATDSRFMVQGETDALMRAYGCILAGKHNSWLDFLLGGTSGARAAHLEGSYDEYDMPFILAKSDLGQKMMASDIGKTVARAIDLLTIPVGGRPIEYDRAVTMGARAMAFHDFTPAVYPELTMGVFSDALPFRFHPYPATTSMMLPVRGGRNFALADRAMAQSGRPNFTLLTNILNVNRMYPPKPDYPLPLRRGSATTVTQLLPTRVMWDPTIEFSGPKDKKTEAEVENTQGNWLRTHWLLQAIQPEYDQPMRALEKTFQPFEKPLDQAIEGQLQKMFGGVLGVYPSHEGVEGARQRVGHLESELQRLAPSESAQRENLERQLRTARVALENYEIRFYQTSKGREALAQEVPNVEAQLNRARDSIKEADKLGANRDEHGELADQLSRRRGILSAVQKSIKAKRSLSEGQIREWLALRQATQGLIPYAHGRRMIEGLSDLMHQVSNARAPGRRRILALLSQRRSQVSLAMARQQLGERMTPSEEVLLSDLEGSLIRPHEDGPKDALMTFLQQPNWKERDRAEIEQVLRDETTREITRRLVRRLPGHGRGTIDSVEESVKDVSRVMLDSASQVSGGSYNRWKSWSFLGRFLWGCLVMSGASVIDIFRRSSKTYNSVAASVGRFAMQASLWRPQLSAEDIRSIEEIRIRAQRKQRPIIIASNHLSWTDITTLMSVIPEARFMAKEELKYVVPLTPVLVFGRHTLLSRTEDMVKSLDKRLRRLERENERALARVQERNKDQDPETRERAIAQVTERNEARLKSLRERNEKLLDEAKKRAFQQVKDAGTRMVKFGLWTIFFTAGTRSETGSIGAKKMGAASLSVETDALILVTSLRGTNEILPISFGKFFKRGTGVHRSISMRFSILDPHDLRSEGEKPSSHMSKVAEEAQTTMVRLFLDDVAELRRAANRGDRMAQAQLAELLDLLRPGMDLVRQGKTNEAKRWAEGDRQAGERGRRTSSKFLIQFTRWWDGQDPASAPPPGTATP